MRRSLVVALALAGSGRAWAGYSNVTILDTTVAFEDLTAGSDEDQNDLVLRYDARCRLLTPSDDLVHEEIKFSPVAAGASLPNELWLGLPGTPSLVTLSDDGGATSTPLCSGAGCDTSVQLLGDFRDGFVGAPQGFVNTGAGSIQTGKAFVVYVEYTTQPHIGTLSCPAPDFQLRRSALVIDGATVLAANGQPLRGAFPGDWQVATERTPLSTAYPDLLTWLDEVSGGCSGSCPHDTWWQSPDNGQVVHRLDLASTAPLPPPATCGDGILNQDETDVDCGGDVCPSCDLTLVQQSGAWRWSDLSVAADCDTYRFPGPGFVGATTSDSGVYTIDPGTGPLDVYCDMAWDGGGWTLVVKYNAAYVPDTAAAWSPSLMTSTAIGSTERSKLSDTQINAIPWSEWRIEVPGDATRHIHSTAAAGKFTVAWGSNWDAFSGGSTTNGHNRQWCYYANASGDPCMTMSTTNTYSVSPHEAGLGGHWIHVQSSPGSVIGGFSCGYNSTAESGCTLTSGYQVRDWVR